MDNFDALEKFNKLTDEEKNTILLVLIATYNTFAQTGLGVHNLMDNMFNFVETMEKMYPKNVEMLKSAFGKASPEVNEKEVANENS